MSLSKEELFQRIREDSRRDGLSIRALARKHRIGRGLVRQALTSPQPRPRKTPVRIASTLGPYHKTIDAWLRADLEAPPKQRHTVVRITARLNEELGAQARYGTVREYVAHRRPQIAAEAGIAPDPVPGFVPRHNRPGQDAEVDFGDVWVRIDGTLTKCYLFVLRLAYSGKAVHRVFASCGQEAFFDGHAHAFRTLGGIPGGVVRYDNLTPAVSKVLFRSRDRVENPRWQAFHQHHGFTPFYCEPGLRGAHEKGGVEGEVGYFRRNYLTPVPEVASLDELNGRIQGWEAEEEQRRIGLRERSIGQDFTAEAPLLRPLPDSGFDTRLLLTPTVDRYSMITVRTCRYSVPARLIGRTVQVMLGSTDLIVYDRRHEVARHRRLVARGAELLVLDHYLEILLIKLGALAGSKALEHARRTGAFTPAHDALWTAAKTALQDKAGTRILVEVLLLHRHMHDQDVVAGIRAALALGVTSPEVVAMEARKHAQAHGRSPTVSATPPTTTNENLYQPTHYAPRRRPNLPADTRPAPALSAYDQLLHRPRGR